MFEKQLGLNKNYIQNKNMFEKIFMFEKCMLENF